MRILQFIDELKHQQVEVIVTLYQIQPRKVPAVHLCPIDGLEFEMRVVGVNQTPEGFEVLKALFSGKVGCGRQSRRAFACNVSRRIRNRCCRVSCGRWRYSGIEMADPNKRLLQTESCDIQAAG